MNLRDRFMRAFMKFANGAITYILGIVVGTVILLTIALARDFLLYIINKYFIFIFGIALFCLILYLFRRKK